MIARPSILKSLLEETTGGYCELFAGGCNRGGMFTTEARREGPAHGLCPAHEVPVSPRHTAVASRFRNRERGSDCETAKRPRGGPGGMTRLAIARIPFRAYPRFSVSV